MDTITKSHVSQNTGEENWNTPQIYIESSRKVFGGIIHTDPASTEEANEIVGAQVFFTKEENGLMYPWYGNVWVNPPYTSKVIDRFIDKLAEECKYRNTSQAIVLVNNATETKWFAKLNKLSSAVVFPTGRIKFWSMRGKPSAPLQGQAFFYIGAHTNAFVREFSQYGLAYVPAKPTKE